MKSLVSIIAIVGATRGASDFDGNPPHIASPYIYSEINSMEYDAETDYQSQNDKYEHTETCSQVVSSLSFDGGCFVSSQAIMCNGGGDPLMYMDASIESDEDFSDDEDDDEDDGHSSMLSTVSLRSKTYAGGSAATLPRSQNSRGYTSNSQSTGETSYHEREIRLKKSSPITRAALGLRGGSSFGSIADNEVARKLVMAAIVTLVFEGFMGHILEFFKIVMQTSPPGTTYGQVFHGITDEKGISGLWDGFVPWGVIQSVLKGGVFGLAHATAIKLLMPLADEGKIPLQLAVTLAGGIGGGFQGYVLSPMLLLKTRVMTNPVFREKMSLAKATWLSFAIGADVCKNEGIFTLMKGANVFATKRVFDWSTRYFFSDLFETLFTGMKGSPLSGLERSASSFLGGVASTCVTLPLDVLVAKMQDAKKAGVSVSPLAMFMDELNEGGLSGLRRKYMQGFEARLLHVCLTTVVLKTVAPIVYSKIFGASSN